MPYIVYSFTLKKSGAKRRYILPPTSLAVKYAHSSQKDLPDKPSINVLRLGVKIPEVNTFISYKDFKVAMELLNSLKPLSDFSAMTSTKPAEPVSAPITTSNYERVNFSLHVYLFNELSVDCPLLSLTLIDDCLSRASPLLVFSTSKLEASIADWSSNVRSCFLISSRK